MSNFIKNTIVFSLLLAGFGIFYHFVIFIPKEVKRKEFNYELCKSTADDEYVANWTSACKTQGAYNKNKFKDCMLDPEILANNYMGEKWCKENYGNIDSSYECSLSHDRAQVANSFRDKALKRCLDEAKTGV